MTPDPTPTPTPTPTPEPTPLATPTPEPTTTPTPETTPIPRPTATPDPGPTLDPQPRQGRGNPTGEPAKPTLRQVTPKLHCGRHCRLTVQVRVQGVKAVRVRVSRRGCRDHHCRWRLVKTRTLAVREGRQTLTIASSLPRASYRVTVRIAADAG